MAHIGIAGRFSQLFPRGKYPRQFWLMFWGMMISTIGSSMVWPFLMIYVTEHLGLPLAAAASLTTINSIVQITSAFIAGPIIDRAGRKWIMVISLLGLGLVYLLYMQASSYAFTALLMALTGLFNPLYRVGGDAMAADLIPAEDRPNAYALLRMANNAGIAIGPAVGGFAAASSYNIAFAGAAIGLSLYAVLLTIFARETLNRPAVQSDEDSAAVRQSRQVGQFVLAAYAKILRDIPFRSFIMAFTLNQISTSLIWMLLSAHAKLNYGIPENVYSFIPVTNALMVVLLQPMVTRQTQRFPHLPVLAAGSLLYGLACLCMALSSSFWGFWLGMVIMSIGELMLMPTASTYTANLAPADMRGRYMSVFGLTWGMASGIGPLTGGILNDSIGIGAPWWLGAFTGLCAGLSFIWLAKKASRAAAPSPTTEGTA